MKRSGGRRRGWCTGLGEIKRRKLLSGEVLQRRFVRLGGSRGLMGVAGWRNMVSWIGWLMLWGVRMF